MRGNSGFTFIEVLVAMLIFVMAVMASLNLTEGSVRAVKESKDITTATMLLQNIIVETETKIETEGFDKGCDKKKDGKFDAPYERYTWTTFCTEIDYNLSSSAAALSKAAGGDEKQNDTQNLLQTAILQISSDYLTKSLREIHAEVNWMQGKTKRKVDVTTHVARYDQVLPIPNLGGKK